MLYSLQRLNANNIIYLYNTSTKYHHRRNIFNITINTLSPTEHNSTRVNYALLLKGNDSDTLFNVPLFNESFGKIGMLYHY